MANTLLGDLNCFTPAFAEFDDAGNSFSSNPDYDEASGPPKDDWFVTVGELEEHAGEDYMLMRQLEEPEDLEQRLYWIDPDEPLGHGETESMVREQARQLNAARIAVDPDYCPNLEPTPRGVRLFGSADFKVTPGPLPTTKYVWKWSKKCGRQVRQEVPGEIVVKVRRKKYTTPTPTL